MKRFVTFILLTVLVIPTFAQFERGSSRSRYNRNNTETYYGLRLGLNIASLNSEDVEFDMNSRPGLAFGAVYGHQLANSTPLWLEAGLFYSEKGGKTHIAGEKHTCRLTYLQLPVVVKYSFDVIDDLYIQPFLGGYMSLGLGGKIKDYGNRTSDASFDSFNRFDGGLRLGCGIEYQMVYAELGFDFGLTNIAKGDFDTTRTQTFFMNIGVNF